MRVRAFVKVRRKKEDAYERKLEVRRGFARESKGKEPRGLRVGN